MAEKRSSLMDDAGLKGVGTPKVKKAGSNQGMKLAIAAVLLVIAGLVVCYTQGWIFAGKEEKPPPPTAEEIKQYDQQKQIMEQKVKNHQVEVGGA